MGRKLKQRDPIPHFKIMKNPINIINAKLNLVFFIEKLKFYCYFCHIYPLSPPQTCKKVKLFALEIISIQTFF